MKKFHALFYSIACTLTAFSCMNSDDNTSLSYHDSGQYYSMKAHFSRGKTRDVDEFMDNRIGRRNNISFANTQSDATLTLDDRTTFYIKKYPGFIEIKLDKDENSNEAYERIRSMCEGLKKVLTK